MPFEIPPSEVKTMLPQATGSLCSQFYKILNFPLFLYRLVLYFFTESGSLSSQFQTDLCALDCEIGSGGGGENPPNPSMPAPTSVNATDGTYSDMITVTWAAVTPPDGTAAVTFYRVYRSLATNSDPNAATLIATVAAPTVTYDDETATEGTIFNFWVVATNGTQTSAFGGPDNGSASAPTSDMDAISNLLATQGFTDNLSAPISLVFTAPTGATKFTVFRNTVNDFETATEIITDIEPQDTATVIISAQTPDQCWDNKDSQIVIYHFPPSATVHYFFWVVCGKDSPPAVSPESNVAEGWVVSHYAPFLGNAFQLIDGETATEGVEFTGTSIRVVLIGPGGGGAGGSQIYGGGGGGAGPVIVEEFAISPGDAIDLVSTPSQANTGNAPALTNGDEFTTLEFRINGVTKMTANGGHGGEYSASGGGVGGAGETGTGDATPTVYDGANGRPGSGAAGGQPGFYFGNKRYPAAHFNGFNLASWDGNGASYGIPGGGCHAAPGTEVLSVGGFGVQGRAVIVSTTL